MKVRMRGTGRIARALALATVAALVAGCGTKPAAEGNMVEMRDMDVIDGTANDAMTDLDAVRSDGIGIGSNELNGSAPAAPAKPAGAASAKDTETVPTE
jgi:hypothetical protein